MNAIELRTWRKEQGLSQTELATLLGVKYLAVLRWEKEQRKIPPFLSLALEALATRLKEESNRATDQEI